MQSLIWFKYSIIQHTKIYIICSRTIIGTKNYVPELCFYLSAHFSNYTGHVMIKVKPLPKVELFLINWFSDLSVFG